jgi:hypothetical protein
MYVRERTAQETKHGVLSPKNRTPLSHPQPDRYHLSDVRSCHIEVVIDRWCQFKCTLQVPELSSTVRIETVQEQGISPHTSCIHFKMQCPLQ